ncbi:Ig-like domain-containing protein [Porphyromonas sp.]|uniref:Ig-like domain-containing protein n=1 Tax=Porphyromonas sp. TaxID=1924944 RepID=UPI003AB874FA
MKKLTAILFATLVVLGLGSCYQECNNVLPQPTALTLNPTVVTLKVGDTQQLTATVEPTDQNYTVTFTSDNEQIATVDANGLVKAVAEGTANIIAKVGNLTAKSVITVSNSAPDVTLTVNKPTLTIEKGKTAQIDYTVTPANTRVTFVSDKTNIATVNATGLVTAVAAGSATITVAAAGQAAQVAVTVTAGNDGGGTVTEGNELPLLKFDPQVSNGALVDQQILAHEKKVGRTAQNITLWDGADGVKPGFVNKSLTISGAVYNVAAGNNSAILALSKETLANCPKTLAMLAEYGFTELIDKIDQNDGSPFKVGINDNDETMGVQLYDEAVSDTESTLQILFLKAGTSGQTELPTEHPVIPTVKDFPSWKAFMTGDIAKIKEFEANLGFRDYTPDESDEAKKNLSFDTPKGKLSQTNFYWVYYVNTPTSGPQFINSKVNFVKNANDLGDAKLKEWFTANGYGKNFQANVAGGYASGIDATGKLLAQIFISEDGSGAMLQIFEKSNAQSAAQMRRLAMKQYNMIKSFTKANKHSKLQRRLHR